MCRGADLNDGLWISEDHTPANENCFEAGIVRDERIPRSATDSQIIS